MTLTLIIGKTRSGKTTLAKKLTEGKQVYALAGNEYAVTNEWGGDVSQKGTESSLDDAMNVVNKTIVIDDMATDRKFMYSEELQQLCTSDKDVILIAQYDNQIPPSIRDQAASVHHV